MKNKFDSEQKEYLDFIRTEPESAPGHVLSKVLSEINALENPSMQKISGKVLGLHLLSALVTLSFCPQFGFNPFLEGHGLTHYFMQFGDVACLFLCGSVFLGVSTLFNRFFLSSPEWRKFKQHEFSFVFSLIAMSLTFFAMWGIEFKPHLSVSWAIGAFLAAFVIDRMNFKKISL